MTSSRPLAPPTEHVNPISHSSSAEPLLAAGPAAGYGAITSTSAPALNDSSSILNESSGVRSSSIVSRNDGGGFPQSDSSPLSMESRDVAGDNVDASSSSSSHHSGRYRLSPIMPDNVGSRPSQQSSNASPVQQADARPGSEPPPIQPALTPGTSQPPVNIPPNHPSPLSDSQPHTVPPLAPFDSPRLLPLNQPTPVVGNWKEWRSWKIKWPWLFFLLFLSCSLIATIAALNVVSSRNSGFVRQGDIPKFLARIPGLGNSIWTQGLLYTAFPAFIMTLYRAMWEATVAAFADRQPYVDLKKPGGNQPSRTIHLDYRTALPFCNWFHALRNGHFRLSACMLGSSVLVLLVIPLTSFLFTPVNFPRDSSIPLQYTSSYSPTQLAPYPAIADVRLSLSSAGAVHIQGGHQPRWTTGQYAFPQFAPAINISKGDVSMETTAYSGQIDCVHIPDSDYQKTILLPGDSGLPAITIIIRAEDRGCPIYNAISLRVSEKSSSLEGYLRTWNTVNCKPAVGVSRFSMLAAAYDYSSKTVSNISLVSCIPSYQRTPGVLLSNMDTDTTLSPKKFSPHSKQVLNLTQEAWRMFFETSIPNIGCFDPGNVVDSNEFGQFVYQMSRKSNPTSPLDPKALLGAAQNLFSTTFSIFASVNLFQPHEPNSTFTGTHIREETRLTVVSQVAYIILSVLTLIALMNMSLFSYSLQESILYEEPKGLISFAGILDNSNVRFIVKTLKSTPDFDGKIRKAAEKFGFLSNTHRYGMDESGTVIVNLACSPA